MTPDTQTPCTCPSGDGSLRWPCAAHPLSPTDALRQAVAELECSNAVMLREAGMGVIDQRVIDAGRAALAAAPAEPAAVSAAIWQWLTADDGGICERWQAILERWDGSDGRAGLEAAAVVAMQGHGIGAAA